MSLHGKRIIVGVSASIAAYKAPLLVRELIKRGAEVRVVMTPSAEKFVSRTVLMNLSKHPVAMEMFEENIQDGGSWHIHLAHWCDAMIIAPCSATSLARLACGFYDTALSIVACALPKHIPLLIAPAMDSDMWQHPAVLRNVQKIEQDGALIIPPDSGELASGIIGPGRLPEIEVLADHCEQAIKNFGGARFESHDTSSGSLIPKVQGVSTYGQSEEDEVYPSFIDSSKKVQASLLYGKHVLITAGPTFEKIDDVRFIGNYSTGKMGFALASQAANMGALVTLITGPVALETPKGAIKRINVESAQEMYESVLKEHASSDIMILSAAVADFTPKERVFGKIKKQEQSDEISIALMKTPDILAQLGELKKKDQCLIGFALESQNEITYGKEKLIKKQCDMIIVNSVNKPDSGFGGDNNTITILTKDGRELSYPSMTKDDCANAILYSASLLMKSL